MAKKERAPRYKTPKGEALYPYLTVPDEYEGRKSWKVDLRLPADSEECEKLKATIDPLVEQAFVEKMEGLKGKQLAKAKKDGSKYYPYEDEYDDDGNATGDVIFTFKRVAEYTDKNTGELKPINIFRYDRFGKRIQDEEIETKIGNPANGTTLRVEWEPFLYYNPSNTTFGCSCRIVSVQFVDIKQYEGGNAGWGDESDGSEAPAYDPDDRDDF